MRVSGRLVPLTRPGLIDIVRLPVVVNPLPAFWYCMCEEEEEQKEEYFES